MKKKTFWILCPIRNGLHYTKPALESFRKQDIGKVRMLFIDNGSTDGSRQFLQAQPDCVVLTSTRPRSVAESWNKGLKLLFEEGEEFVLVLNNDVLLRPDTARLLVEDGGGFVTAVGVSSQTQLWGKPAVNRRPHPDFSCYLIRREVWETVGPFDESYVGGYCEDAEAHLRMHRAGIEAYCIDVPFLHYASGTIKSATPEEAKAISNKADANRALFKERFGVEVGSAQYYELFSPASSGTSQQSHPDQ